MKKRDDHKVAARTRHHACAKILRNRKMEQFYDSDTSAKNPAMLALNAYENVIDQIKSSGLNFQLLMSPFSAQISLKRSLVKERTGILCLPPSVAKSSPVHECQPENHNLESVSDFKKDPEDKYQIESLNMS